MSLREKALTILDKIKSYRSDTEGWKEAKNSVSQTLVKFRSMVKINVVSCITHWAFSVPQNFCRSSDQNGTDPYR